MVTTGLPLIYITQIAGLLAEKIVSPNKHTGCNKHVPFRLLSDLLDAHMNGNTQTSKFVSAYAPSDGKDLMLYEYEAFM